MSRSKSKATSGKPAGGGPAGNRPGTKTGTKTGSRPKAGSGRAVAGRSPQVRPVMFFALLGGCFVALGVYEWLAALISGDLTPTTAGRGTEPGWVSWSVHGQEVLLGLLGLAVLVVVVIIPWRRAGRLSLDGMIVLGCATLWAIQDSWVNYSQTVTSYDSAVINLGCPQCHAPGWMSVDTLAEPIVWGLGRYVGLMYLLVLAAGRVMDRARRRRPGTGPFGLVMVAVGFMAVCDLVLGPLFAGTAVRAFGGADPRMSVFGDSYFRYPLWSAVFWGIAWGLIAALRHLTDAEGRTVVERGLEQVGAGDKVRQALLLLAVIGALNGLLAVAYHVPAQWFGLHAQAFPDDLMSRPYLLGGVCGPGTDYACPDPRVPIPRGPQSGRVNPDGNFFAPVGLPDQTGEDN